MIARLFMAFLKIGFLGFGGGYAMLTMIFDEGQKFGLTIQQFADLNALDFMIPGPIAINSATYVGQTFGGLSGGIAASLAVAIPSAIFAPLYLHYEDTIKNNEKLTGIMEGTKNASCGLIAAVAVRLAQETFFPNGFAQPEFLAGGLLIAALIIHLRWGVNPIILTLASGVIGYLIYFI